MPYARAYRLRSAFYYDLIWKSKKSTPVTLTFWIICTLIRQFQKYIGKKSTQFRLYLSYRLQKWFRTKEITWRCPSFNKHRTLPELHRSLVKIKWNENSKVLFMKMLNLIVVFIYVFTTDGIAHRWVDFFFSWISNVIENGRLSRVKICTERIQST